MLEEELVLCTGKKIKANLGLLSVGQSKDGKWFITEGYDSIIFDTELDVGNDLTIMELGDLANIMIARWMLFRKNVMTGKIK